MLARHLDEPVGVRRVARSDHKHEVALFGQLLDRGLTVGRGVADVVGAGADDRRKAPAQPIDDRAGLVHGQSRLGDEGHSIRIGHIELVDVVLGLDEHDVLGRLAHGALDLLVAGVADQDDRVAVGREALGLDVDLGHQWTGGVDRLERTIPGIGVHARSDAVSGEDDGGALGDVLLGVHEHGAALAQLLDHGLVVDDLLTDVHRRAVELERPLDGLDGPVDARAVSARRREQNLLWR